MTNISWNQTAITIKTKTDQFLVDCNFLIQLDFQMRETQQLMKKKSGFLNMAMTLVLNATRRRMTLLNPVCSGTSVDNISFVGVYISPSFWFPVLTNLKGFLRLKSWF